MSDTYFYDPAAGHGLRHDPFKAIVAPRLIGWISSRSQDGVLNLAPYSFFGAFATFPAVIGFCSEGRKDSITNIEATGEFVWNLASRPLAEQMNRSSAPVAADVDEFALAGLTPAPGRNVAVPHVAEAPAALECKLLQIVRLNALDGTPMDNFPHARPARAVAWDSAPWGRRFQGLANKICGKVFAAVGRLSRGS